MFSSPTPLGFVSVFGSPLTLKVRINVVAGTDAIASSENRRRALPLSNPP